MDPKHRELILNKRFELEKCLELDLLMPFIISLKIFTHPMIDDIYDQEDDTRRTRMFLNELPTRGPEAYIKFIKALWLTDNKKALNLLGENKMPEFQHGVNKVSNQNAVKEAGPSEIPNKNQNPKNSLNCYEMTSIPRGYCLIINNVNFIALGERLGSDLDAERLDRTFLSLNYKVYVRRNLETFEMENELRRFANKKDFQNVDSAVIIILSHGSQGIIYGTDSGQMKINDLLAMFDNENCKHLIGKPKMFFIQACRGNNINSGIVVKNTDSLTIVKDIDEVPSVQSKCNLNSTDSIPYPQTETQTLDIKANVTDMIISYSTVDTYLSIRDHDLGSWYCQALVKVLKERASNLHLLDMLLEVENEMRTFAGNHGERQSTEVFYKGLHKYVYFNVE